jgi:phosphohistidine phosphatase SixA
MRHGEAFRPGMEPDERAHESGLTKAGHGAATTVARRLAETLREDHIDPSTVVVVCSTSAEARDTAAALADQLGTTLRPVATRNLDPTEWTRRSDENPAARWQKIVADISPANPSTKPVLIVGHDPQVSWLLHHLIEQGGRGQRHAGPLPLARGELAMLAGPPNRPRLRYVLSPSDDKLIEEVQAKIKSKMDSAKLLGAFLTGVLVFGARELAGAEDPPAWQPWAGGLGLVLLATATAAYFVTMFRYDELLMPVRLWPSPRHPRSGVPRVRSQASQLGCVGALSEHDADLVQCLRASDVARRLRVHRRDGRARAAAQPLVARRFHIDIRAARGHVARVACCTAQPGRERLRSADRALGGHRPRGPR